MLWVQVLIGLLILTKGRQLFWLFVAAVGFVYGMDLAPVLFTAQPPMVLWLVAIITGLISAAFAYVLEWAAVVSAGFLAGGRMAVAVAASLGPAPSGFMPIPFLIGGIIGAVLVLLLFDWALILLSSTIGALLIAGAINAGPSMMPLVLGALAAIGVIIQAAYLRRSTLVRRGHYG